MSVRSIPIFGSDGFPCELDRVNFTECIPRGFWSKEKVEIFLTKEDGQCASLIVEIKDTFRSCLFGKL